MVLHHTASPAAMFCDLAACLTGSGRLLITELGHHHQPGHGNPAATCGWVFEPADLQAWAKAAGLTEVAAVYLAQRNGFQIQVRLFGHQ